MVLMIGFSAVMMFMMKSVPKEEMEKYQEENGDGFYTILILVSPANGGQTGIKITLTFLIH